MFACAKYKLHHFVPPNAARSNYIAPLHPHLLMTPLDILFLISLAIIPKLSYDWIVKNHKIALIRIVKSCIYYYHKNLVIFHCKCALVLWQLRFQRESILIKIKLTFPPSQLWDFRMSVRLLRNYKS